jgi:hypothetical protein
MGEINRAKREKVSAFHEIAGFRALARSRLVSDTQWKAGGFGKPKSTVMGNTIFSSWDIEALRSGHSDS